MPDILTTALQTEGLFWLFAIVTVAGVVRGFSGFGSAMIIMPVAAAVLSPVQALIFLVSTELIGPIPTVPRAWREGQPKDIALLIIAGLVTLPVGLMCLRVMDPTGFGWMVSGVVIILLVLMISGWRYHGRLTRRIKLLSGGLSGFMTGFVGIPGPPVIMLYIASTLPIATIRANFILHLLATDLLLCGALWISGMAEWDIVVLGLMASVPYFIATFIGAQFFKPDAEAQFRTLAYVIIAVSAVLGLPIWRG